MTSDQENELLYLLRENNKLLKETLEVQKKIAFNFSKYDQDYNEQMLGEEGHVPH